MKAPRLPRESYLSPKLHARAVVGKGGRGVVARASVAPGELLVVWGGQVAAGAEFYALPADVQRHSLHIGEDTYLVILTDHDAEYVNHSCDPNAGLSEANELRALRPIAPGEEVCYDYAMSDGDGYDEFTCACGAPLCRQQISGDDWRRPELWHRYGSAFSPYLQARIARLREG